MLSGLKSVVGRMLGGASSRAVPPLDPVTLILPTMPVGLEMRGDFAVSTADTLRADYHRAMDPAEIGISNPSTKEGFAIIEAVGSVDGEHDSLLRVSVYQSALERIRDWQARYGRKIEEIELSVARRGHLGAFTSDGVHALVRFKETDDKVAARSSDPHGINHTLSGYEGAVEQQSRGGAFNRHGLVTRNGLIVQVHDSIYSRVGDFASVPLANRKFLVDKLNHEQLMNGAIRSKYTYSTGLGEHSDANNPTVAFLGLQFWKCAPGSDHFLKRIDKPRLPRATSTGDMDAEKSIEQNAVASKGYRCPDGTVWRFIAMKGPPPGGNNLGTNDQERRFMEVITDCLDRHNTKEILNLSSFRIFGPHTKAGDTSGEPVTGFYFGCLMRCRDGDSSDPAPVAPPPRPALSTMEASAHGSRTQNIKSEEGVIDPWGEGMAIIEYFSAQDLSKEIDLGEQSEEMLRRIVDWHNRFPNREILETAFSAAEAEFVGPELKGYRRRLIIRFKEKHFEPSMATQDVPSAALSGYDTVTSDMRRRTLAAFNGYEFSPGAGVAIIHSFFGPPVNSNEIGVREGNYQSLLWLNEWKKAHPESKIVEFNAIYRWDNVAAPTHRGNSFEQSYFVRYEPRS